MFKVKIISSLSRVPYTNGLQYIAVITKICFIKHIPHNKRIFFLRFYIELFIRESNSDLIDFFLRNLMRRHSVLYFPPNFRGIACYLAALNVELCLVTCSGNKVKMKISDFGNRVQFPPSSNQVKYKRQKNPEASK